MQALTLGESRRTHYNRDGRVDYHTPRLTGTSTNYIVLPGMLVLAPAEGCPLARSRATELLSSGAAWHRRQFRIQIVQYNNECVFRPFHFRFSSRMAG